MNLKSLRAYARLMRLHKPVGIFLLLWPTLMALWIAGQGRPSAKIVLIFVLGVISMRSAGCVVNDLVDQQFDTHVQRTRNRPLVNGELSRYQAMGLLAVLLLVSLGLVLGLNRLSIQWSFAALALALIYPFMKRYTHWPQVVLGAAFGMSIPMAFAALNDQVPAIAGWLYGMTILWTIIFDTEYAMVDSFDDRLIGLKSTAILFGSWDRFIIGLLQLFVAGILLKIGLLLQAGLFYYLGLSIAMMLFVYQQRLIRDRDPAQCFKAFNNNGWVGAVLFAGLAIELLR